MFKLCGTKIRNWIYTWNVCYKHIYRNVSRTTGIYISNLNPGSWISICCVPESFVSVPEIKVVPSGKTSVKIIFCEVTFPGLLNEIE